MTVKRYTEHDIKMVLDLAIVLAREGNVVAYLLVATFYHAMLRRWDG